MTRSLRIGLSARLLAPRPGATGTLRRTVQYLDPLMANWVMSRDVVVLKVPSVDRHGRLHRNNMLLRDYVHELDGLVPQGGAAPSDRPGRRPRDSHRDRRPDP